MSEIDVILQAIHKRRYPSVPLPTKDIETLYQTTMALKEAVELLTGQRPVTHPSVSRTVTWADLFELGLVELEQLPR